MNQADKEYLQKKGLLRKDETAVDWAIQEAAMKEAVFLQEHCWRREMV